VRPFNTYGPRQSPRAVIPTIVGQLLSSGTVALGNLTPTRDLCYVEDTVAGFIAAGQSDAALGQTVNLGHGKDISIGNLAEVIARLMGREIELVRETERERPPESEVERLLADPMRARELLEWEPHVSLEAGLRRTIEWHVEQGERCSAGYVI